MDAAYMPELSLSADRVSSFGFTGVGFLFQVEGTANVYVKIDKSTAVPVGGGRKQKLPEWFPVTILRVTAGNVILQKCG